MKTPRVALRSPACSWVVILLLVLAAEGRPAELALRLPLQRTAYQCNERIDLAVVRSAAASLAAGPLLLAVEGEDGSRLAFTFSAGPVEAAAGKAQATEHLHLNGWLLRPGRYVLRVDCDGAQASTNISLHSPVRRSTFKLIDWGRAKGRDLLPLGEESLGFNLLYGPHDADEEGRSIAAGVDFMANCIMSGGHQMDLRQECDWSDPYVIRGGTRRAVQRAFQDRTRPNVAGIHFYDEPGLTWIRDDQTGALTPHAIPWQGRQYEAAFGQSPPDWKNLDSRDPRQAEHWAHWARWKLGLMDAAWKDAQFGVAQVRPDYVSATQSQYAYGAFTDGYYFSVARSLPVVSGHGGYHDFGPGYFNPGMFLEFARARDLARPNWYLPAWYGNTTADEFRLEQYLSFQCNLQGLMSPPDLEPAQPSKSKAAQGIVESNHLLARIGTIFNTMPVTRPPVALLFSISQMIHAQTLDRKIAYSHEIPHGRNLVFAWLAGKLLQHQFMPLLDEEVTDGTLAARHKVIILTSLDYLAPEVVDGLEHFAKAGGLVLLTGDCDLEVKGGVRLEAQPGFPEATQIAELLAAGRSAAAGALMKTRQYLEGASTLANAIRPHLENAGLRPPLASSRPGIIVTRQAAGDIEYLLAVNATHDPSGHPLLGLKAVSTTLALPEQDGFLYDVIHSRPAGHFTSQEGRRQGNFRFGPGQMRIWARAARPVGGVRVGVPLIHRDYTLKEMPLRLELSAAVSDQSGGLLSGSVPLRIRVTGPRGEDRYDLYRATDRGLLNLSLPLGLNDPAGRWKVTVTEFLSGSSSTNAFEVEAASVGSAAAGASRRAVHRPADREAVFRFFRMHRTVTIVKGARERYGQAAQRLAKILEPWNVHCLILEASEATQPRQLTPDEAATWIGLKYASRGQIKAGDQNSPVQVGFALREPAILLGTPEDNPLIKFLLEQRFLPYRPDQAEMPGPRRGYIAWQREGLGVNQESIALIAYDLEGLHEAVGTLYEMAAGLELPTPLALPQSSAISPALTSKTIPEPAPAWTLILPDRVIGLKTAGETITALTHDGTLSEITAGKILTQRLCQGSDYQRWAEELRPSMDAASLSEAARRTPPTRVVKFATAQDSHKAVICWGGLARLFDQHGNLQWRAQFPQDITAFAWLGEQLLLGDADGRLILLPTN